MIMRFWIPAVCVLAASTGSALAQGDLFSPQAVDKTLQDGVELLLKHQKDDGTWAAFGTDPTHANMHPYGPTALITYALLEAGVAPTDPRIAKALDQLAKANIQRTYSLALRCLVWQAASRRTDGKYDRLLAKDVQTLVESTAVGSYGYYARGKGQSYGDNSNSQYGLLGVWAGVLGQAAEVPPLYWQLVRRHWLRTQNRDGGWGYYASGGRYQVPEINLNALEREVDRLQQQHGRLAETRERLARELGGELARSGVKVRSPVQLEPLGLSLLDEVETVLMRLGQQIDARIAELDRQKPPHQDVLDDEMSLPAQRRRAELALKRLDEQIAELRARNEGIAARLGRIEKLANLGEELSKRREQLQRLKEVRILESRIDKRAEPEWSNTRATMTVAGIASVYVAFDNLHADQFLDCRVPADLPDLAALDAAMEWLKREFVGTIRQPGDWFYYYLYGVERVGLASGRKFIGSADWYRMGAHAIIRDGLTGGGLLKRVRGGELVNAAFAVLFLSRGRQPVLMNKLEHPGDWNARPRDLAGLTRWWTTNFENQVHWQSIGFAADVEQWHDAQILYVTGSQVVRLAPRQLKQLRQFVLQGGTLLSVTACKGGQFSRSVRKIYEQIFPEYELVHCPPTHPLYNVQYKLGREPAFFEMTNGVRPLVIHTDEDIARAWQGRRWATQEASFQAASNVVFYVTNRGQLRKRGDSHWPEPYTGKARRSVRIARVSHAGADDPEPMAAERFARLMGHRTQTRVHLLAITSAKDLPAAKADLALLTGVGELRLGPEERAGLSKFVRNGGIVLIDAAGGDKTFAGSARSLLREMFGRDVLRGRLAADHDLYQLSGAKVRKVAYRRQTDRRLGGLDKPNLYGIAFNGGGAVYFSPEDITFALLGVPASTADGYKSESAYALLRNVTLQAIDAATTQPTDGQ